jgi:hypothetical protein
LLETVAVLKLLLFCDNNERRGVNDRLSVELVVGVANASGFFLRSGSSSDLVSASSFQEYVLPLKV